LPRSQGEETRGGKWEGRLPSFWAAITVWSQGVIVRLGRRVKTGGGYTALRSRCTLVLVRSLLWGMFFSCNFDMYLGDRISRGTLDLNMKSEYPRRAFKKRVSRSLPVFDRLSFHTFISFLFLFLAPKTPTISYRHNSSLSREMSTPLPNSSPTQIPLDHPSTCLFLFKLTARCISASVNSFFK